MRITSSRNKQQIGSLHAKLENIRTHLQELGRLYRSDTLAEYETKWQSVAEQIE